MFIARDLNFTIEYGDRIERITIPDNESVCMYLNLSFFSLLNIRTFLFRIKDQLRVKMFEKFSIPSHQQTFLYWPMMNYNDQV